MDSLSLNPLQFSYVPNLPINRFSLFSQCYVASYEGNFELLQSLITKDFSIIHHYDFTGQTLMHVAAARGYHAIIEWLHHLNPSLINQPDNNGLTPLDIAAIYGHISVIKTFMHNAIFIKHIAQSKYMHTFSFLLKNGLNPNMTNSSLLFVAFEANQIEKVQLLLEFGAKTDIFERIYKNLKKNKENLQICKDHLYKWLEIFGGKFHPLIACLLSNIGKINCGLNNFGKAFANHSEALEIRLQVLGEHSDTAASLYDLAEHYNHCRKYSEALNCLKKAYNFYSKQPKNRLDIQGPLIECCHNIGIVYKNLGDIVHSEAWHQRAIELKSQIVGQDNIRMTENYKYIAKFYENINILDRAVYYKARAKEIEETYYPQN